MTWRSAGSRSCGVPETLVRPAYLWVPEHTQTLGPEVADLAELAGLVLDPEQRLAVDTILAVRDDGQWAAFEAALIAARQNLKTIALEAIALGGLFLLEEWLVVWTAHEFDTAQESFRDISNLVDGCAYLSRKVKTIHRARGDEGIELMSGARLNFKARTGSGGRGLSGDRVILDEAFKLGPSEMGALLPTTSARPNPQVLYGSSAGKATSVILHALRERGRPGGDPSLAYVEWCAPEGACAADDCRHEVGTSGCALDDPAMWRLANPAMGRRISAERIASERRALPPEEFARERLGWWDALLAEAATISPGSWEACELPAGEIQATAIAFDVALDRSRAGIAVCGPRHDGRQQIELPDYQRGTGWLIDRLVEMHGTWGLPVTVAGNGPGAALVPSLEAAGVAVNVLSSAEVAQACGAMRDAINDGTIAHLGDPRLTTAVQAAQLRSGESSVFRRLGPVDISPLYAVTLAHWQATTVPEITEAVW